MKIEGKEEVVSIDSISADDSHNLESQSGLSDKKKKKSKKVKDEKKKRKYEDSADQYPVDEPETTVKISNKENVETEDQSNDISVIKPNEKSESLEGKKEKSETWGIWIGNLSYHTTKQEVRDFFKICGEISRLKLPKNKTGNKGFAYIDFSSQEAQILALNMNESELGGRNLLIKSSSDFSTTGYQPRPEKRDNSPKTKPQYNLSIQDNENNAKIFIGNLGYDTTRKDIQEFFGEFGKIIEIRLGQFEDTGKCKGFCHLIYKKPESAIQVIESFLADKRQFNLLGQKIRVEFGKKSDNGTKNKRMRHGKPAFADISGKNTKIKFDETVQESHEIVGK